MNFTKRAVVRLGVRYSRRYRLAMAQKWLDWYLDEINGSGLRCEFDRLPYHMDDVESIKKMVADHSQDLDALDKRIAGFDGLREFLLACPPFWTCPNPRNYLDNNERPFLTREVTLTAIGYLRHMHRALEFYAKLLRKYAGTSDVIDKAIQEVALIINPDEWKRAGYHTLNLPTGAHYPIRHYLESVIATEGRKLP